MSIYSNEQLLEKIFKQWEKKIENTKYLSVKEMTQTFYAKYLEAIEEIIKDKSSHIYSEFVQFLNMVHPTFSTRMMKFDIIDQLSMLLHIHVTIQNISDEELQERNWSYLLRRVSGFHTPQEDEDDDAYYHIYYNYMSPNETIPEFEAIRLYLKGKQGILIHLDLYDSVVQILFKFDPDYM